MISFEDNAVVVVNPFKVTQDLMGRKRSQALKEVMKQIPYRNHCVQGGGIMRTKSKKLNKQRYYQYNIQT